MANKNVLREGDEGFEYKVGGFYGRGGVGAEAAVADPGGDKGGGDKGAQPDLKVVDGGKADGDKGDPGKGAQPDLKVIDGGKSKEVVDANETKWPDKGFPPDWFERLADGQGLQGEERTKEIERLKKFSSPAEVGKSAREASRKIQQLSDDLRARAKIPTGKDDHPDDVKSFQRAWGVPESVDDGLKALPERPKELGARPQADIDALKAVMPVLQAENFSKKQIGVMIALMDQQHLQVDKQIAQVSRAWDKEAEETLRQEWNQKGQYDVEIEVCNRTAAAVLGDLGGMDKNERREFLNLTLDNGRKLGSYPKFVKAFNRLGREGFDGVEVDTMEIGEPRDSESLDAEIKKIQAKAHTGRSEDEAWYRSKETQERLLNLVERKNRKDGRKKAS